MQAVLSAVPALQSAAALRVMEIAHGLEVSNNPDPQALFLVVTGGVQVWCTPDDHPQGWQGISMDAGTFSKPCEYVGYAAWGWEGNRVTHLLVSTDAYALRNRDWKQGHGRPYRDYRNRPEDVAWLKEKLAGLFRRAGGQLPRVILREA